MPCPRLRMVSSTRKPDASNDLPSYCPHHPSPSSTTRPPKNPAICDHSFVDRLTAARSPSVKFDAKSCPAKERRKLETTKTGKRSAEGLFAVFCDGRGTATGPASAGAPAVAFLLGIVGVATDSSEQRSRCALTIESKLNDVTVNRMLRVRGACSVYDAVRVARADLKLIGQSLAATNCLRNNRGILRFLVLTKLTSSLFCLLPLYWCRLLFGDSFIQIVLCTLFPTLLRC